jgi:hypothetical protein
MSHCFHKLFAAEAEVMQMSGSIPMETMGQLVSGSFEKFPHPLDRAARFRFASAKDADDDADDHGSEHDGNRVLLSALPAGAQRFQGAHLGQAGHSIGGCGGEIF